MKTILWTQNEEVHIPDTFVINETISPATNSTVQKNAFSELTKASKNLALSPKSRRKLHQKYGTSEQMNFSIKGNRCFIQGSFKEKDNRGRNMPYMFLASDCSNIENAIEALLRNSALINRHCNDADLNIIRKLFNKNHRLILLYIISFSTLIALLWLIMK